MRTMCELGVLRILVVEILWIVDCVGEALFCVIYVCTDLYICQTCLGCSKPVNLAGRTVEYSSLN